MSNPENNTINAKITKLNEQVQWFYSDDFSLDRAEENYKNAANLAKEIEEDLDNLKNKIEILSQDFTK
ncbi:exodeoxyribonuclease VII small subunit [Candidatus Saccharibacteria bacterium]|nr:exodeoxyribonuclease VII small subunit [Candidatus Saccharibacteria bacterium]